MPIEITMPKLSDTMEQGTILRWYKREGEHVDAGEVLAEVETDKADMELEAADSGTLREIRVQEGGEAAVGAVIAVLSEAQDSAPKAAVGATAAQAPTSPPASTAPRSTAAASKEEARKPTAVPPRPTGSPTLPPSPQNLRSVPPPPTARGTPSPAAQTPPIPSGRQDLSRLRLAVAKQMTASKREVPHFYVTVEIDMTEAARARAALADAAVVPERITYTHFLIKALALTLARHPRLNASWSDGGIAYHQDINIGVAVAVEDGLVAPVLRGCQKLPLRAIAAAATELVNKAQSGRFGGDELTGATFTLSNMGMLDVEEFSAVITPPQAAILAVGSIKDRPVVRAGQIAVAKTMRVTLSVDHRIVNGVEAGRFLEDLKGILEKPLLLLLGE